MRWRLMIPGLLLTMPLGLVGCGSPIEPAAGYPVAPPDSRPAAPAFIGVNQQGQPDQVQDLEGNVVLVNLEFPGDVNAGVQRTELAAVVRDFSVRDLTTLRVIEQPGPVGVVTAVVQGYIITLPDQVGLHERARAIQLGLTGLPYLLVIDRRGRIAARIVGVADPARLATTIHKIADEL
jgi:hypothetical protein